MLYHELKEASLHLHQAPVRVYTPATWTSQWLNTALRSEVESPIKNTTASGTITCVYLVDPLATELHNAPTNDQGESLRLPRPPPLRKVCPFLLPFPLSPLCPFRLLPLLPLPKSSIRQKTELRCSEHSTTALQDATWECSP